MSVALGATSVDPGKGLISLPGWKQAVNNTVASTCSDDTTGSLGGYSYTGGNCAVSGKSIGALTYSIVRIADPNNILGTCTSSFITGQTSSCAASGATATTFMTQSDGYN
jgi:hypothetical protein